MHHKIGMSPKLSCVKYSNILAPYPTRHCIANLLDISVIRVEPRTLSTRTMGHGVRSPWLFADDPAAWLAVTESTPQHGLWDPNLILSTPTHLLSLGGNEIGRPNSISSIGPSDLCLLTFVFYSRAWMNIKKDSTERINNNRQIDKQYQTDARMNGVMFFSLFCWPLRASLHIALHRRR